MSTTTTASEVILGELAARVLAALGEGFTTSAGPLLPALVSALVGPGEDVATLVAGEDGWSSAFDLDDGPAPGWLGQLAGVSQTPGTLDQQRDRVRARGYSRGTLAGLQAAGQGTLTGSRTIVLLERDTSAYHVQAVTFTDETPDPAATVAALRAALPAGIRLDLTVRTGQTWAELTDRGLTFAQLATYTNAQVARAIPGQPIPRG